MTSSCLRIAALAIFGLSAYTQSAQTAQAQAYLRLDTGYSFSRDAGVTNKSGGGIVGSVDTLEKSPIYGGGIGYKFGRAFRTDFTASYRGGFELRGTDAAFQTFRGDVTSWAYMLNGYFDIPTGSAWTPYVGAGVGHYRNRVATVAVQTPGVGNFIIPEGKKYGAAWSVSAGVGYPLGTTVTLDIGYRYLNLGKIETPAIPTYSGLTGKLAAHELAVGIRF
jgi:opacity protein-like surface antigen